MDRSKTRAASGGTTLNATRPVTALLLSTCWNVCQVGNVSGAQNENTTMITIHT